MKLSIIIPQFSETERQVAKLLVSIERQRLVEGLFDVTIVNDCSEIILSDDFLSKFSFPIQYVKLKSNVGSGMCRQAGINATSGDYVMFCDADDYLCRFTALFDIISRFGEHPDVVWAEWLSQMPDKSLREMNLESTWLHGKAFRRLFLNENRICFRPEFRVHEDTYFVGLAWEVARTKSFVHKPLYVYAYNEQSISRRSNGSFLYEELDTFLRSCIALLSELKKRNNANVAEKAKRLITYASPIVEELNEPTLCRILLDKVREFTTKKQ